MPLKIGAYVRVSTDEQASAIEGSLDNQRYRLRTFIELKNTQANKWGDIIEFYVDDGYSAKDTRRPAYQRLMNDVRQKKIELILITDLSRLSRNIFDFCSLMGELEKTGAQFLSLKEQFDSSTPAGKMMIYNMINLAQFEREQVSERVALGTHARSMRGLLNGGRAILGYDKSPSKPGSYVVNESEAADVRKIFRHFLNTGSRTKTILLLEEAGIKPKSSHGIKSGNTESKWCSHTLGALLKSPAYIGYHEVNKRNKARDQSRLKPHQQYKLVKASWPAIISETDFNNTKILLDEAQKLERARFANAQMNTYILSGILRCSECGSPLIGQTAHGRKTTHRYYGHTRAHAKTDCAIHRISAQEAEAVVLDYVLNATKDTHYLDHVEGNLRQMRNVKSLDAARDKRSIVADIKKLEIKIENLLLMQNQARTAGGVTYITNKFNSLSNEKAELEGRLANLTAQRESEELVKQSVQLISERLSDFRRGFAKARPAMKKMLLKKLLKQVLVSEDGLHIFMLLADGVDIPNHQIKLIRLEGAKKDSRPQFALVQRASGDGCNVTVHGSVIGKLGGPDRDRTGDL